MDQNFNKYILSLFIIFLDYQCPFKCTGNKIIKIIAILMTYRIERNVKLLVRDTK